MNNNENHSAPLVTIAVITYNSAKYVIETLDSIKAQTYSNIELVISDDNSKDDTVQLCNRWLDENKNRFVKTKLLTVDKNTGVTGNCNRALFEAEGEWMKDHAADDILLPDAIEKFLLFVDKTPEAKAVFGHIKTFIDNHDKENSLKPYHIRFSTLGFGRFSTAKLQHSILSRHYIGCAPAFFINTSFAKSIGGYDERFPTLEDSPMYLRITKNGYKLFLMPDVVVHQRVHEDSISNSRKDDSLITDAEVRNVMVYHDLYHYENSTCFWKIMSKIYQKMTLQVVKYGNTKHSFKSRFYYQVRKWGNPYKYDLIMLSIVDSFLSLISKMRFNKY